MKTGRFFPKFFRRRRIFFVALALCTVYLFYQLFIIMTLTSSVAETEKDRYIERQHSYRQEFEESSPALPVKIDPLPVSKKKQIKMKDRFKQPLGKIILGVSKFDFKLYQENNKNFKCVKSGEEIPYNQVNDDYCDCQDGSDEPSTDACPQFKFHCIVETFDGLETVPSSMVNDGICDCCDGSDEWLNRTHIGLSLPSSALQPDIIYLKQKKVYLSPCIYRCP